jgi:hypothetical protein
MISVAKSPCIPFSLHVALILDMPCNVRVLHHEYGRYICPDLAVSLGNGMRNKKQTVKNPNLEICSKIR